MKLIKEDINFERGQTPKKAMEIGITVEKKLNFLISKLNEFIPIGSPQFIWFESDDGWRYEIYRNNSRTLYATYDDDDKIFNIGDIYGIQSVEEAIKQILTYLYPNLDDQIRVLYKVKSYLEK